MQRLLFAFLATCLSGLMVAQVITITFEAELNGVPEPLDSILVMNLDQGGATTIYFPNNQLVLGSAGIAGTTKTPITLHGIPNPFAGSTEVLIGADGDTELRVEVHDASGRQVATLALPASGTSHRIAFTSGQPGMHLLSVTGAGKRSSLRLLATEAGAGGYGLNYLGPTTQLGKPKGGGGFSWTPGVALRCVGYATDSIGTLSSYVELVPTMNTTETFQLVRGLVCPLSPTVTDIDGNTYATVKIGDQCWMAENLRTSHYRDGTPITQVTDNTIWAQANMGAWCNYNNDPFYDGVYGKLYNWYAVYNPYLSGICPQGWHVPTDADWQQLEAALGMPAGELGQTGMRGNAQNVGGKLKANALWNAPNTGATNESGFSGLPGGNRFNNSGFFGTLANYGYWWSASEYGADLAWYRGLDYGNAGFGRNNYNKRAGFCVRCVRD